jgi:hypothetical protein
LLLMLPHCTTCLAPEQWIEQAQVRNNGDYSRYD